jgi:hypothetical protein
MQIDCHCQQPSQGLMRGCEFEPKCQHFDSGTTNLAFNCKTKEEQNKKK